MSSPSVLNSVRRLRCILAGQHDQEQSDAQLLTAFADRRDDVAFATLVRRHGPMVLGVCRRMLGHEQDAEDAFQATFLVLALRAPEIRQKTALPGFLHGIACHMAAKVKRAAGRRRKYEGRARSRQPANPTDELSWREVRTCLDEEIARLPEKYRSAFVLCWLESVSRIEAATRLGVKEGTLSSRLAEARKRLQKHLARRGVELTAVLAASALATPHASALPWVLMVTTIKAARAMAAGEEMAGIVSAPVTELARSATATLMLSKAKMATAIVLTATLLSGVSACFLVRLPHPQGQPAQTLPAKERTAGVPLLGKRRTAKTVAIRGRVLAPDGKPAEGARVFVDPQTPNGKPLDSATTGKDGRFSLKIARSLLIDPETRFPLRSVRILATAKGCGLDWLDVPLDDAGKEATLRLVKDDVPIQGRLLSLEGKPLTGIKVRIQAIEAFPRDDLDRALAGLRKGSQIFESTEVRFFWYQQSLPDPSLMATTGTDGRFRLEGIGRERIVTLKIEGTGIHYHSFNAMTRRATAVRGPHKNDILYGAAFDYTVKPSRLLRGTVREKGTGKPLAGIRISGLGFSAYVTAETVTDEQGRYKLPGCPKESRYGVVASPSSGTPFFGASIYVPDTPGMEPLTVDLELMRGIPCEGKVLEENDQVVPGEVRYCPLFPNPNVSDDRGVSRIHVEAGSRTAVQADGTFRCVILPGCGCLAFRAAEPKRYRQACVDPSTIQSIGDKRFLNIQGSLASGGLLDQEDYQAIQLIKPAKETKRIFETLRVTIAPPVNGTIVCADGGPLTGVRVRGLKHGEGWETLPSAKFNVHGVNPLRPRRLYYIHDARRLIGSVEVKGMETKPLTVRMQPWAGVRGRLLDKEGNPLRNMKVSGSEFVVEKGHTDDQGRFRLDGLLPGLRYDLHFAESKSARWDTLWKGFTGKPGEIYDLGDVRVQPPHED